MSKKIWYLISIMFGIGLFFKLFRDRKYCTEQYETPMPQSKGTRTKDIGKRVLKGLNARQVDILKIIEKRKILLPSDIYELQPQVSTRTLRRDMTSLVQLGLVKQEGSTKDTRYILVE